MRHRGHSSKQENIKQECKLRNEGILFESLISCIKLRDLNTSNQAAIESRPSNAKG